MHPSIVSYPCETKLFRCYSVDLHILFYPDFSPGSVLYISELVKHYKHVYLRGKPVKLSNSNCTHLPIISIKLYLQKQFILINFHYIVPIKQFILIHFHYIVPIKQFILIHFHYIEPMKTVHTHSFPLHCTYKTVKLYILVHCYYISPIKMHLLELSLSMMSTYSPVCSYFPREERNSAQHESPFRQGYRDLSK